MITKLHLHNNEFILLLNMNTIRTHCGRQHLSCKISCGLPHIKSTQPPLSKILTQWSSSIELHWHVAAGRIGCVVVVAVAVLSSPVPLVIFAPAVRAAAVMARLAIVYGQADHPARPIVLPTFGVVVVTITTTVALTAVKVSVKSQII